MKRLQINNSLSQIINRYTFVSALIVSSFVFVLLFALSFFRFSYDYDDYAFTMFFSSGDDVVLFMGVFLSKIIAFLQSVFPFVNVFGLFLIISGFVSFVVLDYIILRKYKGLIGLLISAAFDAVLMSATIISLQWTQTAAITCTASCALIIFSALSEQRKKARILQFIIAGIGAFFSSQLRFSAAIISVLFSILFLCCIIFRKWICRKDLLLTDRIKYIIKRYISVVVSFVVVLGISFGCITLSNTIKTADSTYKGFEEYSSARSLVQDYPIIPYSLESKDFYNQISIYSESDLNLLIAFGVDHNFYTVERMNMISKYAQQNDSGVQNIYLSYFEAIKNKIKLFTGYSALTYPILFLLFVAVLFLLFLLYRIRNRIKPVFIILLFMMWTGFFLYTRNNNVLFSDIYLLIFFVVSSAIALFGNRYQFFNAAVFSFFVILLYNYLLHYRLPSRVSYALLIPPIVYLLLLFRLSDIRNSMLLLHKGSAKAVLFLLSIALIVYANNNIFSRAKSLYDEDLVRYINSNSDELFFNYAWDTCAMIDHAVQNPLAVSDYPDNSIHYGSWPISSFLFEQQLCNYDIQNMFEEMINNDKRFFIISKAHKDYAKDLEVYYNSHFNTGGEIYLNSVYSTDNADVYKVKNS